MCATPTPPPPPPPRFCRGGVRLVSRCPGLVSRCPGWCPDVPPPTSLSPAGWSYRCIGIHITCQSVYVNTYRLPIYLTIMQTTTRNFVQSQTFFADLVAQRRIAFVFSDLKYSMLHEASTDWEVQHETQEPTHSCYVLLLLAIRIVTTSSATLRLASATWQY